MTRDEAVDKLAREVLSAMENGIDITLQRPDLFKRQLGYIEEGNDNRINFEKDVWLKTHELTNSTYWKELLELNPNCVRIEG